MKQPHDDLINEITGVPGTTFAPAPLLKRRDIFVKDTSIYILDSFSSHSNARISAFCRRINDAITIAQNRANTEPDEFYMALDIPKDENYNKPVISIYLNCPDATTDPRFKPALIALMTAIRNGAILKIYNIGDKISPLAKSLYMIYQALHSQYKHSQKNHHLR